MRAVAAALGPGDSSPSFVFREIDDSVQSGSKKKKINSQLKMKGESSLRAWSLAAASD